jgi:putative copper export protein
VTLYHLSVTLHVLAALLWLGGMLFLAAVGAPVLRHVEPAAMRAQLFRRLGEQFRLVGWIAIGTLVVTGITNLYFRGWLGLLDDRVFWGTPFGRMLLFKLVAVTLMLGIQAIHDFRDGPRASRTEPGSPEALRFRKRAAQFARLNAVLGIVLVYIAVRLARGG